MPVIRPKSHRTKTTEEAAYLEANDSQLHQFDTNHGDKATDGWENNRYSASQWKINNDTCGSIVHGIDSEWVHARNAGCRHSGPQRSPHRPATIPTLAQIGIDSTRCAFHWIRDGGSNMCCATTLPSASSRLIEWYFI